MPFGIKGLVFNSNSFTRTFIGRKARRTLQEFLDGIGHEEMEYIITNDRNLLDYIPNELKINWKANTKPYGEFINSLTNDEVYSWISGDWRAFIEAQPNGRDWAYRLISSIRSYLLSA